MTGRVHWQCHQPVLQAVYGGSLGSIIHFIGLEVMIHFQDLSLLAVLDL